MSIFDCRLRRVMILYQLAYMFCLLKEVLQAFAKTKFSDKKIVCNVTENITKPRNETQI